ncbi:TonB-dependent receptor [Ichthyobacterium seriolicida]|uniref:TonB-dependent receptor n=2 Tax=Ichthyobacterium seriolicida TaxID=242600 RepID=A0A1J1E386_9FLAO|nr:TonB-dependent receptor [Ichthyobacterium seriolicida]
MSYVAMAGYDYDKKYYLTSSFRMDGSSRFHKDIRWGNFYSIGAGWIVSNEDFMEPLKEVLSFTKVNVSYGELGNNKTMDGDYVDYFPYISTVYEASNGDNMGYLLSGLVEDKVTWEKVLSFNVGLNLGFFNDRIELDVDYYRKVTKDLLLDKPLPPSIGWTSILVNEGGLLNYGFEGVIRSKNISTDDFKWNTSMNFSLDRNTITELNQKEVIEGTKKWMVGKSIYDFFIPEYAGVDPKDGMAQWYKNEKDKDGKKTGKRVLTKKYSEADKYYQGSSLPDIIGGFNNYISYGDFDLDILLNFSFGGMVYDNSYSSLTDGMKKLGKQQSVDIKKRWTKPGDRTDFPLLLSNSINRAGALSSRYLFKNDYIRLKAVTLGYNIPNSVIHKINLSKLRVYLQGDNLLTYQSHKGIDPEQSFNGVTNSRSRSLRTFSLGVKIEF